MEQIDESRIAQEIANMQREAAMPAPASPVLSFAIEHPGVDVKNVSGQAVRRFVAAVEAVVIRTWFPKRDAWPKAQEIKVVELQVIAFETSRCATATASAIADVIRRKLCHAKTAVEVVDQRTEPRAAKGAARIVVHAKVVEVEEPGKSDDGYAHQIRQADGFDNVGNPCYHRDEDACRIRRCAWIMPGSQMPADPDPLEVKAAEIERVFVERDEDPPSVLHADDPDAEYMAVKGWLHGPMRHDVDLTGGSSSKGRVPKPPPKPPSPGERAILQDGQI